MEILDHSTDEISCLLELLHHVGIRKPNGPDKASTRHRLGERQPETGGQGDSTEYRHGADAKCSQSS